MDFSAFWGTGAAERVKHPAVLRQILGSDLSEAEFFELTFHSRFANSLMGVLRREGSDVEGFQRMQQSFTDSVSIVRSLLEKALGARATGITELSHEGLARIMDTMADLALVKDWLRESRQLRTEP